MNSSIISVSDCNCSLTKAYLYFIYIIDDEIGYLYIGETSEARGAMGRLAYHLQYDNQYTDNYYQGSTFVKRLIERTYFDNTQDIMNITMICYDLSEVGDFTGDLYKKNREAVEFLVQDEMRERSVIRKNAVPYLIVSKVENNSFTRMSKYQELAKQICDNVIDKMPF